MYNSFLSFSILVEKYFSLRITLIIFVRLTPAFLSGVPANSLRSGRGVEFYSIRWSESPLSLPTVWWVEVIERVHLRLLLSTFTASSESSSSLFANCRLSLQTFGFCLFLCALSPSIHGLSPSQSQDLSQFLEQVLLPFQLFQLWFPLLPEAIQLCVTQLVLLALLFPWIRSYNLFGMFLYNLFVVFTPFPSLSIVSSTLLLIVIRWSVLDSGEVHGYSTAFGGSNVQYLLRKGYGTVAECGFYRFYDRCFRSPILYR